jgi:flavodoxin
MKSLVLYDSVFGCTEKVSTAIGEALSRQGDCEVVKAADFTSDRLTGVDRLFIGSPTRAFRPTPELTAKLSALHAGSLSGIPVHVFDTRVDILKAPAVLRFMARLFGYAAGTLAKLARAKGGTVVGEPVGFLVAGTEGPLLEGELERAVRFAESSELP